MDVDIEHLRPNRPLLELSDRVTRSDVRVIAVSDTYLGQADLWRIFDAVAGRHCIAQVSVRPWDAQACGRPSFAAVAERESVVPSGSSTWATATRSTL